ncbi:hypothetical protein ES705_11207 [subsurface metagenome]
MSGAYRKERIENACYYFYDNFKNLTGKTIIKPILSILLLLLDISGLTDNLRIGFELDFKTSRGLIFSKYFPVEILNKDIDLDDLINKSQNAKFDSDYFTKHELRCMKKIAKYSTDLMANFEIIYDEDLENIST